MKLVRDFKVWSEGGVKTYERGGEVEQFLRLKDCIVLFLDLDQLFDTVLQYSDFLHR